MNGITEKKYFAFISYKREDEEWAKWLQHKLEHYKLPSNLNGRTDLPKEIRPIFRDQSDLAGGVLADEINKALESSKYLIVICSPRAAQSEWVGKEVQTFLDLGRVDKIIPFIIGGTAYAQESKDECFPLALRELPSHQELLGVNINEMGRDAAAVKVVAQMFELKFDELWQRYEKDQKKRKRLIISAIASAAIVIAGLFSLVFLEKHSHNTEYDAKLANESRRIADLSYDLVDNDNPYLAQRLLIEVLPKNLKHPERPYTIEAEAALRHASLHNYTNLGVHNDAHFSPDGKQIVVASNNQITLWDAQTRDTVKTIGHINHSHQRNYWRYAVFSPNGKKIVSSRGDTTMIWDIEKGNALLTIKENERSATLSASYSPDGKQIISKLENDRIKIWDAETGENILTFHNKDNSLVEPSFSSDGKHFLTESNDTVWVWDAKTNKKTQALDHLYIVSSAMFSPNGKLIVTISGQNNIQIWDLEKGKVIKRFNGESVSFSHDGKRMASINDKGILKIWNTSNWSIINRIHLPKIGKLELGPNTELLLKNSSSYYIHQNNYKSNLFLADLEWSNSYQTIQESNHSLHVIYSLDGKHIASSSKNGSVTIWDTETGNELYTLKIRNDQSITNIMFGDEKRLACIFQNTAIVWDIGANKCIQKIERDEYEDFRAMSRDFKKLISSMGKHLVCYDENGNNLWLVKTAHDNYISTASFSPNGKIIVTTAEESTIKIWDAETGKLLHTLNGHKGIVNSAAFNTNGTMIVSTSNDYTIKIWDIEKEQAIHSFNNEVDPFSPYIQTTFAYFSPDDQHIISTNGIWDINSEIKLQTIDADADACFGPGGEHIVTSASDGSVLVWHFLTPQELIDHTWKHFKNNPITEKEREQFNLTPIK